jgi:hypothetical protein
MTTGAGFALTSAAPPLVYARDFTRDIETLPSLSRPPRGVAMDIRQQLIARSRPHRYARNPVGWARVRLGEYLWSKQVEVAKSLVRNSRVAVRSCHDTGKSHVASRLVAWWLDTHPVGSAFAVTTAPTAPQVEAILWREINTAHVKGKLPGRITGGSIPKWKAPSGELLGYGRKPQDLKSEEEAMQAFQGIHARYVLVILDEACGIPTWLWNAVETIATNQFARVLAIGNPDNPDSHFKECFFPGSGWARHKIAAVDTPAWTGEKVHGGLLNDLISPDWVDRAAKDWGIASPIYRSKVDAEFSEVSEDTLFTPSLLMMGQAIDLSYRAIDHIGQFGLDVARGGTNETACYRNRGGYCRLEFAHHAKSTMATAGRMREAMESTFGFVPTHIDVIGVGGGVYDRMKEQDLPVAEFRSNEKPLDEKRFTDRRSELFWGIRMGLERGEIDLPPDGEDDKLIAQLGVMKFEYTSTGKIKVESKEDMAERGHPSPDRADAFMHSFARYPSGKIVIPQAWGQGTADITSDLDKIQW